MWNKLIDITKGKDRIIVIGSGPTAEYVLKKEPHLLKNAALITVNMAILDYPDATIEVAGDAESIEHLYSNSETIWVTQDKALQGFRNLRKRVITVQKLWGKSHKRFGGSGAQAVRLAWDLAQKLRKPLVTTGLDFGLFYPPQVPIRYAKNRQTISRSPKQAGRWEKAVIPGRFEPFGYRNQIRLIKAIAARHRKTRLKPKVVSKSAINWLKLPRIVIDTELVQRTIDFMIRELKLVNVYDEPEI